MAENKPIGQLLEELGYINQEQIKVALDVQKANPKYFGEILQELDFITSGEVAEAIAKQAGLEYVDLEHIVPSTEALRLIPQSVASSKSVLPISLDGNDMVVATQDINDIATLDYLRKLSLKNVRFVVSDKKAISRYTEIFYYQLSNPIEKEIADIVKASIEHKEIDIPHLVELLLNSAIKDRVTDIHITPDNSVTHIFYRIDGVLQHYYSLPIKNHQALIARVKILSNLDISEQRKPQDGSFSYKFLNENFDLRISSLPTNYGENVVMRLLGKNASIFSLSHLGLTEKNSQKVEKYFQKPYGIILIAGPTGSGKTTTLYSALRKVDSLKKNVLTIEDPIEYKFSFIKQTQLNEKAGYTFENAIRAFMRQDPDVMLVGEIRDSQTAELAIRASITGHLVLSTVHTNDAVGTISRLSDLQVPPYLIASGLLAVIAQRLIRKLCSKCKKEIFMSDDELLEFGVSSEIVNLYSNRKLCESVGCEHCRGTGYSGRAAIVEILEIDKDIESLIIKGTSTQEIQREAQRKGMHTMKEDGYIKALEGLTTLEEVHRVVN